MPQVSVIIPNFNHAAYLDQRINTVLSQTYQDFEVILLDDCSTDNSKEVLLKYSDNMKVAHVIFNDKNSGSTFNQWKKGLHLAKGKYIWIAESDDYSDPTFLEKMVTLMENQPNIGLSYSQSFQVNEKNEMLGTWDFHTDSLQDAILWKSDFISSGMEFGKKYMFYRNVIPNASAVLFRKKIISQVFGIDKSFKLNGDWFLYLKILSISDVGFLSEPLNYFREHSNKGSSKNILKYNNIKEYYRLYRKTNRLFKLTFEEKQKILNHIFAVWMHQSSSSILYALKYKLFNVSFEAFRTDWRLLNRYFQMKNKK